MISVIKVCLGVALFGLQDVNDCAYAILFLSSVGNGNNSALILFEFILGSISWV